MQLMSMGTNAIFILYNTLLLVRIRVVMCQNCYVTYVVDTIMAYYPAVVLNRPSS